MVTRHFLASQHCSCSLQLLDALRTIFFELLVQIADIHGGVRRITHDEFCLIDQYVRSGEWPDANATPAP